MFFVYLFSTIFIALSNAQPCTLTDSYGLATTAASNLPDISVAIVVDCIADVVNFTLTGPSTDWIGLDFGQVSGGMIGGQPNDALIYSSAGCGLYTITSRSVPPKVSPDPTLTFDDVVTNSVRTVVCQVPIASLSKFAKNDLTIVYAVATNGGLTINQHSGTSPQTSYTLTFTTTMAPATTMAATTMAATTMAATTMAATTMANTTMAATTMAATTMAGTTTASMPCSMYSMYGFTDMIPIQSPMVKIVKLVVDCMYDTVNITAMFPDTNWVGFDFGKVGGGMSNNGAEANKAIIYSKGKDGADATGKCAEYDITASNAAGVAATMTNTAMTISDMVSMNTRTIMCAIPIASLPRFTKNDPTITFGVATVDSLGWGTPHTKTATQKAYPLSGMGSTMAATTTMMPGTTMSGVGQLATFGLAIFGVLLALLI